MSVASEETVAALPTHVDVVIVGAGFSGLAMAARLGAAGRSDFLVLERAGDVGGVWRDNTYPGAACDVPSHVYSLSFAQNPDWSRTFSHQREIHAYLQAVARDHGLLPHIALNCELLDARWDGTHWQLDTARGPVSARVLVSGSGPLVEPKIPDLPGLDTFPGAIFHSARWDHDHDLTGDRVAVVGTGASAIQFVPKIQPQVAHMTVFQRTAAWVLPRTERPITPVERFAFRHVPGTQSLMRQLVFWGRESNATPLLKARTGVIELAGRANLLRGIRDRELRRKLTPRFRAGCKRLLLSNTYFPALAAPNVDVVAAGLTEVRGSTVIGADGSQAEVDTIIFGTGFEVTRPPVAEHVHGADGRSLAEVWDGSMQAHRGTTVAGFPNLFFLLGPNSGSGHMSVVYMAEAQADYVVKALDAIDREGAHSVQPRLQEQDAWTADVQARSQGTVWLAGGCASWYLDDKGRNTTLWPDYAHRFAGALKTFHESEHEFAPAVERVTAAV
ncbi:MAG: hypothetical protein QOF76_808 [Solirubrobacteraceae bacterium]|jgi:cation diffusion facilitator CzcD-associated flavoprotein CzcO|nr:hypothetical protein [Solirubrobacteraceae bacterium]